MYRRLPSGWPDFHFNASGGWPDRETAFAATGDTAATITVNGQPAAPATTAQRGVSLNSQGRLVEPVIEGGTWHFSTFAQATLEPGEYNLTGEWIFADGIAVRGSCILTITNP